MELLLDTNAIVFLAQLKPERFTAAQLAALNNPRNTLFIAEATIHECAIKQRTGRFPDFPDMEVLAEIRKEAGIRVLRTRLEHYEGITRLPVVEISGRIHSDPFDLLIISTAIANNLPVITRDSAFRHYAGLQLV